MATEAAGAVIAIAENSAGIRQGHVPGDAASARDEDFARIAFLHIPKTAGTSLTQTLARRWPRVRIVAGLDDLETLPADLHLGCDLVAGHFYGFQLGHPALTRFTPVTVLRDPFERLLSSWRFMRLSYEQGAPLTPGIDHARRVSFAEYAFSGIGATDRHGQLYILGLDSIEAAPTAPLRDLLQKAQERLAAMHVGVTEELPLFVNHLMGKAGVAGPVVIDRLLVSPVRGDEDGGLSSVQRAALREVMAPDFALHAYARELMLRRLEAGASPSRRRAEMLIPSSGGSCMAGPENRAPQGAVPAVSDLIQRLKTMQGPIRTLQKLCDAADWADPRLLAVAREAYRLQPRIVPRMWEFTMAYLALARAGMLDGDKQGLTFGSGQEPLIFAAASRAASLLVTDLYTEDSSWDIARTDSPKDFVLRAAPPGFDASNLEVRSMDMRRVDVPDASIDFCYSISAFEHIGDDPDFLQHLREVRRVLRPGGVYVMTTEVRLGHQSSTTRSNYCFAIGHLLRLFREAGLHPEPCIDMRLSDMAENDPRDLTGIRHHDPAEGHLMTLVVREFGGIMSAPVLFVLRAESQGPVVIEGLEDTLQRVRQAYDLRTRIRGNDWMRLNPWGLFGTGRSEYLNLYAGPDDAIPESPLVFATGYTSFGTGMLEVQIVLTPDSNMDLAAPIDIAVNEWSREDQTALKPCYGGTVVVNATLGCAATLRFRIPVDAANRYSILGARRDQRILLAAADVQVRCVPAEA